MYELLSFPSEVEHGDRKINFMQTIAMPPDYKEWFDERKFYYCQFGLNAHNISEKLRLKYKIERKVYNDWDAISELKQNFAALIELREKKYWRQKEPGNRDF